MKKLIYALSHNWMMATNKFYRKSYRAYEQQVLYDRFLEENKDNLRNMFSSTLSVDSLTRPKNIKKP